MIRAAKSSGAPDSLKHGSDGKAASDDAEQEGPGHGRDATDEGNQGQD
jgi:hypothetical protein